MIIAEVENSLGGHSDYPINYLADSFCCQSSTIIKRIGLQATHLFDKSNLWRKYLASSNDKDPRS